jgi:hypothetical protein
MEVTPCFQIRRVDKSLRRNSVMFHWKTDIVSVCRDYYLFHEIPRFTALIFISQSMHPFLCQMNPVNNLKQYISKLNFNIFLITTPWL